jgi:hypothetical protein
MVLPFFFVFLLLLVFSLSLLGLTAPCYYFHHQPTNQPNNPNYYYYYYYHHLIPGVHLSVLVVCWYRYTIPGLVITYSKFLFFPFFTFVLGALLPFFSEHFVAEFFSFFL